MELPAEVAAAYEELARGRRQAAVERERRIGRTYVLLGVVFLATIGLGSIAAGPSGPAWPVGAILLMFIAAYALHRRWLRHMKVDARGFTGLPPIWVAVFVALSFFLGPLFRVTGIPYDGWSPQIVLFGVAVFAGGILRADRLHAILGLGAIALGIALFALQPGSQIAIAIAGIVLGGALVGLGLIRYFTPPASAP